MLVVMCRAQISKCLHHISLAYFSHVCHLVRFLLIEVVAVLPTAEQPLDSEARGDKSSSSKYAQKHYELIREHLEGLLCFYDARRSLKTLKQAWRMEVLNLDVLAVMILSMREEWQYRAITAENNERVM